MARRDGSGGYVLVEGDGAQRWASRLGSVPMGKQGRVANHEVAGRGLKVDVSPSLISLSWESRNCNRVEWEAAINKIEPI